MPYILGSELAAMTQKSTARGLFTLTLLYLLFEAVGPATFRWRFGSYLLEPDRFSQNITMILPRKNNPQWLYPLWSCPEVNSVGQPNFR
jgi:hypothetical protein